TSNSWPIAERISQPSCTPIPRNERTEVRFALSYDDLKTRSTSSATQISAIFFAIRQTNFSDSMTHGPRINAGRFPPMVTFPRCKGFAFINEIAFCRFGRLRSIASPSLGVRQGRFTEPPAPNKIDNGKRSIQTDKKEQCDPVHLQQIKRAQIGEKTQNRKRFRLV